jgi:hypothetical protein
MSLTFAAVMLPLLLGAPSAKSSDARGDLSRGQKLLQQFKYAEASKVLSQARTTRGLDRATLLTVLELLGVCYGQQRQSERAEQAFLELLTLDSSRTLRGDYGPRVMTPFFAAQQAVAEAGALSATAATPVISERSVDSLVVSVDQDPLEWVQRVRFHLVGRAKPLPEVPVTKGLARATVEGREVRWWAELLGANDEQLLVLGSEVAPLVAQVVAPVAEKSEPVSVKNEPHEAIQPSPSVGFRWTGGRIASLVCLGLGAAAAGSGAYFGLASTNSFRAISTAPRSMDGVVTGLTEVQGEALREQGRTQALVANVLFGVGGAAALGAVILWAAGAPASPVVLLLGPSGVTVSAAVSF